MTFNDEPRDPSAAASPKKPWNAPRLHRYGTLAHLTETVANMGRRDGGLAMGRNRTH